MPNHYIPIPRHCSRLRRFPIHASSAHGSFFKAIPPVQSIRPRGADSGQDVHSPSSGVWTRCQHCVCWRPIMRWPAISQKTWPEPSGHLESSVQNVLWQSPLQPGGSGLSPPWSKDELLTNMWQMGRRDRADHSRRVAEGVSTTRSSAVSRWSPAMKCLLVGCVRCRVRDSNPHVLTDTRS